MQKSFIFLSLLFSALVLSACTITVEPVFSASNLKVSSNFTDENGNPYICYDQTTIITYTFEFKGTLDEWEQSIREYSPEGEFTGRQTYHYVIDIDDPDAVVANGLVTYTFTIAPGTALEPLSQTGSIAPQQTVVVDTRLFVEARGFDVTETLSQKLPTRCLTL